MTQETLTSFFGWCVVLNYGFLLLASLVILTARDHVAAIHGKMFDIAPDVIRKLYFQWLGFYKVFAMVVSLVPWIALKLI